MSQNLLKMSRKSENVESPKTDSPDLIPGGVVGIQGTPGDPWEPLGTPGNSETFENPENQKNPEISSIPAY